MRQLSVTVCLVVFLVQSLFSEPVTLKGMVTTTAGAAIAGATVRLAEENLSATTDEQGVFTLSGATGVANEQREHSRIHCRLEGDRLRIFTDSQPVKGRVEIFSGDGRRIAMMPLQGNGSGMLVLQLPEFMPGLSVMRVSLGASSITRTVMQLDKASRYLVRGGTTMVHAGSFTLAKSAAAAAVDTLIASKSGYTTGKVPIDSYEKEDIAIVLEEEMTGDMPLVYEEENTGADCNVTTSFPSFNNLPNCENFPDPFLMDDGSRITKKSQWKCRRAEISNQIQYWETGTKPPTPKSDVTATFSGNRLTVTVKVGSQSYSSSTTITYPSGGTPPYPALIQMGGGMGMGGGGPSGIFTSRGCAVMSYNSSDIIANVFPGRNEKFQQLFPEDKTAGAFIAWAWGISRLIDGLQLTADENKIDTRRLAVTGCSYMGKMALYAGAFDERIALTMPQEAGGGGECSWRYMSTMPTASPPGATTNDRLEDIQAAQGTGWYSTRLKDFTNATISKLPIDQHSLVAMIAPRAVLVCMNADVDRGGAEAGHATMLGAAEVWKALGVPDRVGYTIPRAGGHCSWSSSADAHVASFVDRFMFDGTGQNVTNSPYNPSMSKWITWETPTLE